MTNTIIDTEVIETQGGLVRVVKSVTKEAHEWQLAQATQKIYSEGEWIADRGSIFRVSEYTPIGSTSFRGEIIGEVKADGSIKFVEGCEPK